MCAEHTSLAARSLQTMGTAFETYVDGLPRTTRVCAAALLFVQIVRKELEVLGVALRDHAITRGVGEQVKTGRRRLKVTFETYVAGLPSTTRVGAATYIFICTMRVEVDAMEVRLRQMQTLASRNDISSTTLSTAKDMLAVGDPHEFDLLSHNRDDTLSSTSNPKLDSWVTESNGEVQRLFVSAALTPAGSLFCMPIGVDGAQTLPGKATERLELAVMVGDEQ